MVLKERYDNIAISLHWVIALAIFLQLASGIWMVEAIKIEESKNLAYNFYQYHKSLGLIVLVLSLLRLFWRLTHKAPALPETMKKIEKLAANIAHTILYFFIIFIPLVGWGMVSTSSYGLPTIIFGLFEWPHLTFLGNMENKTELHKLFLMSHSYMAYAMLGLIILHILAALKHQLISKDNLLKRMLP